MIFFRKPSAPGTVPALFVHIQKTAGTSIVHVARQFYGTSIMSHGEFWGRRPRELRRVKFISGHIGYQFARSLMRGRYSFTFLRDPVDRILSLYYFCRTRDQRQFEIYRKAHELDLAHFLEAGFSDPCVRMHIWNNQVWQLAHGYTHMDDLTVDNFCAADLLSLAKEHLGKFSYVGFTETFAVDAPSILSALRLPADTQLPISNPTPGRPRADALSSGERSLIEELTALDRELYEYALKNSAGRGSRAK